MQTVPDETTRYDAGIIVCPSCNTLCPDNLAKTIFEQMSGIAIGFMLYCPECNQKNFINMLGRPPLFDLSGRYSFVDMKEG
jgi:hypothetical protein